MYALKFKYNKYALIKHKICFYPNKITLKNYIRKDKLFYPNDIIDIKYTYAMYSRHGYYKYVAVTFNNGLVIYICENFSATKKNPEFEFFKKNFSNKFSNKEIDRLSV